MVHNMGELVFLEQLCGFCCFSMHFIVIIDLLSTIIQPLSVAYVSFFLLHSTYCYLFSPHLTDHISAVSHHQTRQIYPYTVIDQDCSCLLVWCSSSGLCLEMEVGYDRLDDFLHPRNPSVLLPTTLLILENGRFLLGTNLCGTWRVWEEDHRPCMCCIFSLSQ